MAIREVCDSRLLPQGINPPLTQVQKRMESLLYGHCRPSDTQPHEPPIPIGLEKTFQKLQRVIYKGIASLAISATRVKPETTSWSDESIRLQALYKHLQHTDPMHSLNKIHKVCEAFLAFGRDCIHSKEDIAWVVSRTRKMIGRVVFVAERNQRKLLAGIDPRKLKGTSDFVKNLATEELLHIQRKLIEKNKEVNRHALQNKHILLSIEEPKAIAKILLAQGQLNLGMIKLIKGQFFAKGGKLFEYQQAIIFVLSRIDLSWQKIMDAVEVPRDFKSPACAMIRAELNLLPSEEITKLHCQQVVLSALLSQLCEEPVGNRFAVTWALKKQDVLLGEAAKEYVALIRDGYLTRIVDGRPQRFFFENTVLNPWLSKQITLNPDGTLPEFQNTPFWECSNFKAACHQMGLTNLRPLSKTFLQDIFQSDEPKTVTWDDLICACARSVAGSSEKEAELLKIGRYGFCLSHNRLIAAWQACQTAVQEACPGGKVRDNINRTVMGVFAGVFSHAETYAKVPQKALVAEVKRVFQKTLNASLRLNYNGSIGPMHRSGYELYQCKLDDEASKGTRIATPDEFTGFIFEVIERTSKAAMKQVPSEKDRIAIHSMIQNLQFCADHEDFMKKVLHSYDNRNHGERDPVAHYAQLASTPMTWTVAAADDPWDVPVLDTDEIFTPDVIRSCPTEDRDLLKRLLEIARWKETTRIPQALPIEVLELEELMESGLSTDRWIQLALVDPAMQISESEMQSDAKKDFAERVKGWLLAELSEGIPRNCEKKMQKLFTVLNTKVLNVQQFAQRSQDGLTRIFNLKDDQLKAWSLAWDELLLQSFPEIRGISVRFPEAKDRFFFFNPRTQKVDLMLVDRRVSL